MLEYHKEDEALLIRNLVTGQALCGIPPPAPPAHPPSHRHPRPLPPPPSSIPQPLSATTASCCTSDQLPGDSDAGVSVWAAPGAACRALGSCFPCQPQAWFASCTSSDPSGLTSHLAATCRPSCSVFSPVHQLPAEPAGRVLDQKRRDLWWSGPLASELLAPFSSLSVFPSVKWG